MAKKTAKSAKAKAPNPTFKGQEITKGEKRKLDALRKSIGDELGEDAFDKWLKQQRSAKGAAPEDKNAKLIEEALVTLKKDNPTFKILRGGYLIKSGRSKKGQPPSFIVTAATKA